MYNLTEEERERPQNFEEHISGDETWKHHGLRIRWTEPVIPLKVKMHTNAPVRLRMCVESKKELCVPPEELTAWAWTPIVTKSNPRGIWKEIPLEYNPRCTLWDDHGITSYVFSTTISPTREQNYRVTFNIKWGNVLIWANLFKEDANVDVAEKPSVGTQTHVNPSIHFTSNFANGKEKLCESRQDHIGVSGGRREDLDVLVMF